jgi:hypothetical protein
LESNPEQFRVEDEVKLTLELKNVQTLYIKIFEFNTETYYKKTLQPFNTGVNLDGLIASTERVVEDFKDRPANKKYQETFSFPELANRVGLRFTFLRLTNDVDDKLFSVQPVGRVNGLAVWVEPVGGIEECVHLCISLQWFA